MMTYKHIVRSLVLLSACAFFTNSEANSALAAQFLGGPSVRVSPNASVEFKWITDVAWYGRVEIFTSADASGTSIFVQEVIDFAGSLIFATRQTVTMNVATSWSADYGV
jgi:hypothetical protein